MPTYNFKKICKVPTAKDFIDIVLSRTQRQTPTVVRKRYNISRIRQFYMRKVKHTQTVWNEKLSRLLEDFPRVDDIHPFYSDLLNVLYDKDHYKIALGQLSTARNLIDRLAKDYVKLLKYGDSLYRCKQLKRAALGRMAKIIKRQAASLSYLEQVRQHMSRLPSIDPNERTVVVCGYPNVGKSSFMNKVTRADVEVEPYAFTTRSLYVGHSDYKYLRWQMIDTPGLLDRPLEERNTIEMQSITALAHLNASVLYIVDVSEQCGYTIQEQAALFDSIRPLFVNKPLIVALNKCDARDPASLPDEDKETLKRVLSEAKATTTATGDNPPTGEEALEQARRMSTLTEEGVVATKEESCERLLERLVQSKLNTKRAQQVANRLNFAVPGKRDSKERPAMPAPESVREHQQRKEVGEKIRTTKDEEEEQGGPGVFTFDDRRTYDLERDDWKYDIMPEVMDGKNVMDFYDPEVEAKLEELEREEMEREALEGAGDDEDEEADANLTKEERDMLAQIRQSKRKMRDSQARKRSLGNTRPRLPRTAAKANNLTASSMRKHLSSLGLDPSSAVKRASAKSRVNTRKRSADTDEPMAANDGSDGSLRPSKKAKRLERGGPPHSTASKSLAPRAMQAAALHKPGDGFRSKEQRMKAQILCDKAAKRGWAMDGRKGPGDQRHMSFKEPMHLIRGKHGVQNRQHR